MQDPLIGSCVLLYIKFYDEMEEGDMPYYAGLSEEIQEKINIDRIKHLGNPFACNDLSVRRRDMTHDRANLWRPAFVRDIEKILHLPYYNRYSDKTQVFSLYKNDDISRRAQHVQLVARIAKNIGRMLGLNEDLIEAIALGHDIGHTPFGHAGERKLNELYHARTGRYFNHNIQSARVFDVIFPVNLSLQTLDGIICHNGEMEMQQYKPVSEMSFEIFDERIKNCLTDKDANKGLIPSTLEACVMRVSDIIAYLGKDRQDAIRLGLIEDDKEFEQTKIGKTNGEIINNMIVNIVENSFGKSHLQMDKEYFEAFAIGKRENYQLIYMNEKVDKVYKEKIYPMFEFVYDKMRSDLVKGDETSYIFRHHIKYIEDITKHYPKRNYLNKSYRENDIDDIVVDYIASMTDDYLIDLCNKYYSDGRFEVEYVGYFD